MELPGFGVLGCEAEALPRVSESILTPCNYLALRTPTKGQPVGTYTRTIRESQRVEGLRSKLSPKEVTLYNPYRTPILR